MPGTVVLLLFQALMSAYSAVILSGKMSWQGSLSLSLLGMVTVMPPCPFFFHLNGFFQPSMVTFPDGVTPLDEISAGMPASLSPAV